MVLTILLVVQRIEAFEESEVRNLCSVITFGHVDVQKLAKELLLTTRSWAENFREVVDQVVLLEVDNVLLVAHNSFNIEFIDIFAAFGSLFFALEASERIKTIIIFKPI